MNLMSIFLSILMTLFPFINWGTNDNQEVEQVTPPVPPIVEATPESTPEEDIILPGDVVFEAENASATLIATRGNTWDLEFKVDGTALFLYGDTCVTVTTGTVVSITVDAIATAELITVK